MFCHNSGPFSLASLSLLAAHSSSSTSRVTTLAFFRLARPSMIGLRRIGFFASCRRRCFESLGASIIHGSTAIPASFITCENRTCKISDGSLAM